MDRLAYLLQAYRLKDRARTGWGLRGVEGAESVADHSWGTALLCLLFADEAGVDRVAALEIALVHDLAEAETGDLPFVVDPRVAPDRAASKARRESEAMVGLLEMAAAESGDADAAAQRVYERWRAYEERADAAARFVRDMNLLDMALQALVYASRRPEHTRAALAEFVESAAVRVVTPLGRRLVDEVAHAFSDVERLRPDCDDL